VRESNKPYSQRITVRFTCLYVFPHDKYKKDLTYSITKFGTRDDPAVFWRGHYFVSKAEGRRARKMRARTARLKS